MKKPNPVVLIGAVLAAVGVAVLIGLAGRGGGTAKADSAKVQALVATAAVAAGTPAEAAHLEVRTFPASAVVAGSPSAVSALQGQVALRAITKGEVIALGVFGTQGVAARGGVTLPKGTEAMGIELGFPAGALRYVIPHNKVTVWATQKGSANARPLLQNVLVIATTPGAGTGEATATVPGPGNLDFLLAVTRPQAAQLIGAQVRGDALYVTLSDTGS